MEENIASPVPRRRRHSVEFKAEAVQACLQPGVSTAAMALRYGLNANLLRRWVKAQQLQDRVANNASTPVSAPAEFIPLSLPSSDTAVASPDIVIEVRRGATTLTVRWPQSSADACVHWLQGWLR
jgi:transposase-like protein